MLTQVATLYHHRGTEDTEDGHNLSSYIKAWIRASMGIGYYPPWFIRLRFRVLCAASCCSL